MTEIERLFAELNYPSLRILEQTLKSRGINYDKQEASALVKGEPVRQIQAPAPISKGKIAADNLNDLWFADLIDLTAAPSAKQGKKIDLKPTDENEKYILVVQRVFDRFIWTRALKSKRPMENLKSTEECCLC